MSTVLLGEELRFRRLWRRLFVGSGDALGARGLPGRWGGAARPAGGRRRGSLEGPGQWLAESGKRTPPGGSWSASFDGEQLQDSGLGRVGLLQVPLAFGGGSADARVPVIPSRRRGVHGVVRPRPGGFNQGDDLAGEGVMTPGELAPWLRPSWLTRLVGPGSGCVRRVGRSRRG